MKQLIMIIGEPGSGKSAFVKEILSRMDYSEFKYKLLRGYKVSNKDLYVFGIYFKNEIFEGTDKLSMGVQPSVCEFILNASKNSIFITEGDRLGNSKLLNFCKDNNIRYHLVHLYSEHAEERRIKRGSQQSESWIKSRKTKIKNLLNFFSHESINNQENQLETIVEQFLRKYE